METGDGRLFQVHRSQNSKNNSNHCAIREIADIQTYLQALDHTFYKELQPQEQYLTKLLQQLQEEEQSLQRALNEDRGECTAKLFVSNEQCIHNKEGERTADNDAIARLERALLLDDDSDDTDITHNDNTSTKDSDKTIRQQHLQQSKQSQNSITLPTGTDDRSVLSAKSGMSQDSGMIRLEKALFLDDISDT